MKPKEFQERDNQRKGRPNHFTQEQPPNVQISLPQRRISLIEAVDSTASESNTNLKYNPFVCPADIPSALLHGKSQRVCKPQNKRNSHSISNEQSAICKCCGRVIENELYPLSCQTDELLHLGITYPMYFDFIRQCAILLSIHLFISALPCIIINLTQHQCQEYPNESFICNLSFLNLLQASSSNPQNSKHPSVLSVHSLDIETLCNMLFLLVSMVILSLFKIQQKIKKQKLLQSVTTISDFSLFLTNLPSQFEMTELHDFIISRIRFKSHNLPDNFSLGIVKEYRLYDLKKYAEMYARKVQLHKKIIEIQQDIQKKVRDCQGIKQEEEGQNKQNHEVSKNNINANNSSNNNGNTETLNNAERNSNKIEDSSLQHPFMESSNDSKLSSLRSELIDSQTSLDILIHELEDFERTIKESSKPSNLNTPSEQFSGKVIITVNEYKTASKVLKCFKLSKKEKLIQYLYRFNMLPSSFYTKTMHTLLFKNKLIIFLQSPQPSDILWANIGSTINKCKYFFGSYVIVYILIFLSFLILLFLKREIQSEQNTSKNMIFSLLLSFSSSAVVALFNTLLGISIRKAAKYEEHSVQTLFFCSVGFKLTKMFIVNMVISTLASNMVHYYIFSPDSKQFPFDAQGLMGDFFFLFITNSYMGSLFNIFDIMWGLRLIKRRRAIKNPSSLTQLDANNLFEGHPIDMALRYANVNKTVLFTASVAPFIPVGVPLSIIGLLVIYWVDKYLLLRRYVCKNYLSFELPKQMLNSLKIYCVFFAFGNMLTMFMPVSKQESENTGISHFEWPNRENSVYFYVSILGFVIALGFRYFPMKGLADVLYNCFFKEKYQKRVIDKSYIEMEELFAEDYDQYHPIFKQNRDNEEDGQVQETKEIGNELNNQQGSLEQGNEDNKKQMDLSANNTKDGIIQRTVQIRQSQMFSSAIQKNINNELAHQKLRQSQIFKQIQQQVDMNS